VFIYWGSKGVSTKLGYAADFCPLCRSIRPFQIIRIGKSSHVYGVTMGTGNLIGHNRECVKCGVVLGANPVNYKDMVKRLDKKDVPTLVHKTFPNIEAHHAERLRLETFLRDHPDRLNPDVRRQLLAEPFQLIEHVVQRRFGKTHIDLTMVGIVIVAVILVSQLGHISAALPFLQNVLGPLILAIFIGAAVAVYLQGRRAERQYMRDKIYPVMARALRPLNPKEDELRTILAMLTKSKATTARKVDLRKLMQAIGDRPSAKAPAENVAA